MSIRHLTILGATGTIGVNTLDVVARHPGRFNIVALSGNHQLDKLAEQCRVHSPRYAVVLDAGCAARLREILKAMGSTTEVLWGIAALEQIAALPEVDTVMAAIVGAAGLRPALAAAKAGKRILLANKETLVMAGSLFMQAVAAGGAELIPIDSEHNAIFQSLPRHFCGDLAACGVRRILLTASGGPFRTTPLNELAHVTPAQACAHPNWVMGKKISVDSATMMNKGLEVIEAHWLFNATPAQIQVVIHPQSVIHSMVDYLDGSVIAQLGNPDMRTPIAYALGFPERIDAGVSALDLLAQDQGRAVAQSDAPEPPACGARGVATGDAGETRDELQVFDAVQVIVEIRLLGQEAQGPAAVHVLDRLTHEPGPAAAGLEQAGEDLERRGLAGAVWPEVSEDLAPADLEVQVLKPAGDLERPVAPVALGQPLDPDGGVGSVKQGVA